MLMNHKLFTQFTLSLKLQKCSQIFTFIEALHWKVHDDFLLDCGWERLEWSDDDLNSNGTIPSILMQDKFEVIIFPSAKSLINPRYHIRRSGRAVLACLFASIVCTKHWGRIFYLFIFSFSDILWLTAIITSYFHLKI